MKKIIFYLRLLIRLHIEFISDFIFLVLLLIDINISVSRRNKTNIIRVLIEFLGRTDLYYCYTSFSRYKSENKNKLYTFYYSLKNKNTLIFQILCFFYSFFIEYYLQYLIYILIPYEFNSNFGEFIEDTFFKLRKKMQYYTKCNFHYCYLKDLKEYYKDRYNKKYYKDIIKAFFWETYLNLLYDLRLYRFKFGNKIIDKVELKIEDYF